MLCVVRIEACLKVVVGGCFYIVVSFWAGMACPGEYSRNQESRPLDVVDRRQIRRGSNAGQMLHFKITFGNFTMFSIQLIFLGLLAFGKVLLFLIKKCALQKKLSFSISSYPQILTRFSFYIWNSVHCAHSQNLHLIRLGSRSSKIFSKA